jgi:hypothetical protein
MAKRITKTPTFLNEIQRDCYRFILEEEEIKEDYEIGGKVYKEVEWEYIEEDDKILVRLYRANKAELLIGFNLCNFPVLRQFLAGISSRID